MLTVPKNRPDAERPAKLPAMTFRPDRAELFEVLDELAGELRQSRNVLMILLLEEILTQKGRWPPKSKRKK